MAPSETCLLCKAVCFNISIFFAKISYLKRDLPCTSIKLNPFKIILSQNQNQHNMKLENPIPVAELASRFNAKLVGDESNKVKSIREIRKVEPGSLTYVDNTKYYESVLQSEATVIAINKKVTCPKGKTLLILDDPFHLYNTLANELRPYKPLSKSISSTATLGKTTIVEPGAVVGDNVQIGENCVIHSGAVIYSHSILEDHVIVHSNAVIGADAFYYKERADGFEKMHSVGRTILRSHVEVGACSTIDSGVSGDTIIGYGTKIDNHVHVGHGTVIGKNCLLAAQVGVAGKTFIGDGVKLYGKVGVNKDITIGKNSIVLASSDVSKSLNGNKTYFGTPAVEAKEKWKELVYLRMLPKIWSRILLKPEDK